MDRYGYNNDLEYYFISKELGKVKIPPHKNFLDGNGAKYARDSTAKGVMRVKSNQLEFVGKGYEYLKDIDSIYGIFPEVRHQIWMKDPNRLDEKWFLFSENAIDFTEEIEFDHTKKIAKAKYTNGGLYEKVKSMMSETLDLKETSSVTGIDIGPLETVDVLLEGRDIFLESKVVVEEGVTVDAPVGGFPSQNKDNVFAVPFQIKKDPDGQEINNDRENLSGIVNPELNDGGYGNLTGIGGVLYLDSNKDRRLILNGNVRFKISYTENGNLYFGLLKYSGGSDLIFIDHPDKVLATIPTNGTQIIDYTFTDYILDINEGESWTLGYYSNTDDTIQIEYLSGNELKITEDSIDPPSYCKALKPFYMFDRILQRAFGESGLFKSDLFGEGGEMESVLKTNGFYVRQFPDVLNEGTEEERKIQFKTSLKKQIEAFEAITPLAWWIEPFEDKEVLRIEKLSYTQQNFIGIYCGELDSNNRISYIPPQKLLRVTAPKMYFSSATIGSSKTGKNYKDFFGLTAFCGNADFSFVNDKAPNPYIRLTEDRTGDIDVEITRRKPFENYPDRDTDMDDDIFFLDCKLQGSYYTLKKWQDIYEVAPRNIYRPDSAYNLAFTPARLLLNHGYVINAGLRKAPNEFIRWSSSNCNSSLITKKTGENELYESPPDPLPSGSAIDDFSIPHTILDNARVTPMRAKFTMPVPLELEQQINAYNPDGIPNWYGLVAVSVNGSIEYFRFVDVDTNKEGKWQLIEANIT